MAIFGSGLLSTSSMWCKFTSMGGNQNPSKYGCGAVGLGQTHRVHISPSTCWASALSSFHSMDMRLIRKNLLCSNSIKPFTFKQSFLSEVQLQARCQCTCLAQGTHGGHQA